MKKMKPARKRLFSLIVLFLAGVTLILAGPWIFRVTCILFRSSFEANPNYKANVVTTLVAIFVLYFVLVQLTYSVSDIPTGILSKYTLKTKKSFSFIIYFFLAITFTAILAFQELSHIWYWILTFILVLSLFITILYLFWFVKRMSVEEILKLIKLETNKALRRLNDFEEQIVDNHQKFSRFLEENENCSFDPIKRHFLAGETPCYTLEVKNKRETCIKEIDFNSIKRELNEIWSDPQVEVIFEVVPSSRLSEESSGLLTLLYEHGGNQSDTLYLKVKTQLARMKEAVTSMEGEPKEEQIIDAEIARILKEMAIRTLPFFKMEEYENWLSPLNPALQDLNNMTTYAIKRETELDHMCNTFHEIIFDQLFGTNPKVYLELKKWVFDRVMQRVRYINDCALNKENVQFLDKMIDTFYRLTYSKVAPSRNRDLFEQIFSELDNLHTQFMVSHYGRYYPKMTSLVLIISEWIRFLREDFEKEQQADSLGSFYKPVAQAAIETGFRIIKTSVNWFKKDQTEYFRKYLHEQMQQFIKMLQFQKEHPHYYFDNPSHYYTIKFAPARGHAVDPRDRQQYELANQKAEVVTQLKTELQRKIVELSIYMVYKFSQKELPSEFIWKIALPATNVSYSYYGRPRDTDLTELYNDSVFHGQATEMFDFLEIHPSGPILLGQTKMINTLWVLLNIQRLQSGKSAVPSKTSNESKLELLSALNSMSGETWAEAVNMRLDEFETLKQRYLEHLTKQMEVTKPA